MIDGTAEPIRVGPFTSPIAISPCWPAPFGHRVQANREIGEDRNDAEPGDRAAGPAGHHRCRCGGHSDVPARFLTRFRVVVAASGIGRLLRPPDPAARCRHRRASAYGVDALQQPPRVGVPVMLRPYARDTWQLVHAGAAGGHHDIPVEVANRPQVFTTLTAPSYGAVHNATGTPCHPAMVPAQPPGACAEIICGAT